MTPIWRDSRTEALLVVFPRRVEIRVKHLYAINRAGQVAAFMHSFSVAEISGHLLSTVETELVEILRDRFAHERVDDGLFRTLIRHCANMIDAVDWDKVNKANPRAVPLALRAVRDRDLLRVMPIVNKSYNLKPELDWWS